MTKFLDICLQYDSSTETINFYRRSKYTKEMINNISCYTFIFLAAKSPWTLCRSIIQLTCPFWRYNISVYCIVCWTILYRKKLFIHLHFCYWCSQILVHDCYKQKCSWFRNRTVVFVDWLLSARIIGCMFRVLPRAQLNCFEFRLWRKSGIQCMRAAQNGIVGAHWGSPIFSSGPLHGWRWCLWNICNHETFFYS